jgi:hypothetical protein
MKRADALNAIRFAGYHDDSRTAVRIYVENRISRAAYVGAWAEGQIAKQNGKPCGCPQCQREAKPCTP